MGNIIRAGNPRLHKIDISVPGFLAREDVVPVKLPSQRTLPKTMALREETASSRLSLEEEIDQFQLKEERKEKGDPVICISDIEDEFERISGVRTPGLVVTKIDDNSEEEEEEMALNPRKGLKDLLAGRFKGSSSKKALKSKPLPTIPPPPPTIGLLPMPNLKKKRKEQEMEEGEVVRQKEAKQQKMAQDKGLASSIKSREDPSMAEVR